MFVCGFQCGGGREGCLRACVWMCVSVYERKSCLTIWFLLCFFFCVFFLLSAQARKSDALYKHSSPTVEKGGLLNLTPKKCCNDFTANVAGLVAVETQDNFFFSFFSLTF